MLKRQLSLPQSLSFFLLGPRQTGKSTLVQSSFTQDVWGLTFLNNDLFIKYSKHPEIFRLEAEEKIKNQNIKRIFLDEVQRIPDILNEVHFLIEKYQVQFILTGSSARKLKRSNANLLAGRAIQKNLFPLTVQEVGEGFNLEEALKYGSLPKVFLSEEEEKIEILKAYTNTYLREEIQQEALVRNLGGFSRFLDIAAAQCGELINYSAFASDCSLPIKTVQSYYDILEDTLIGFKLHPWRKSVRKRLVAHPRFYFFDLGVTNSINQRLTAKIDPLVKGRLFEQFIILEISRQIKYSSLEVDMFFWRTNIGTEVDLLITKNNKLCVAIEIKSSKNIHNSDLNGLLSFREENLEVPCYLVADVSEPYRFKDVLIIPWKQFLLKELMDILHK